MDGRTVGSPKVLLALVGTTVGDSVVGGDDSGKGRLGASTGDMASENMLGNADEGSGDTVEGVGESLKGMGDDVEGMTDIGAAVGILGVAVSSSRRIVGLIVGKFVVATGAVGASGIQDENVPSKQVHCKKSSRDFS